MIYIGIDPGVHTGVAVWNAGWQKFMKIKTCNIIRAFKEVKDVFKISREITIVMEDARKRKWYTGGLEKLQGVGSVKRDCKIWEEFCSENNLCLLLVAPCKGMTKWNGEQFKKMTGWEGITSNHSRDAALLVFGRK